MPERSEKLQALVKELESELQGLDSLDDETKQMLESASQEIREALTEGQPAQLEPETLIDRLKVSTEDFEASHPTLSSVVGRMIDVLGQMGI